jgi:hypothetical protein
MYAQIVVVLNAAFWPPSVGRETVRDVLLPVLIDEEEAAVL